VSTRFKLLSTANNIPDSSHISSPHTEVSQNTGYATLSLFSSILDKILDKNQTLKYGIFEFAGKYTVANAFQSHSQSYQVWLQ